MKKKIIIGIFGFVIAIIIFLIMYVFVKPLFNGGLIKNSLCSTIHDCLCDENKCNCYILNEKERLEQIECECENNLCYCEIKDKNNEIIENCKFENLN